IKDVFMLLPVVLLLLFLYLFHGLVPPWLLAATLGLLRGQAPHLTTAELLAVILGGGAFLLLFFGVAYLMLVLVSRFRKTRMYDQRLVQEKTARPAYRVRLRLFVFAAGVPSPQTPQTTATVAALANGWWLAFRRLRLALHSWKENGRKPVQVPRFQEVW